MTTVGCPLCDGPVDLQADRGDPACRVGHAYPPDDLNSGLQERATRALWAAITALGDEAAGVRWRAKRSGNPEELLRQAKDIEDQVQLLRSLTPRRVVTGRT